MPQPSLSTHIDSVYDFYTLTVVSADSQRPLCHHFMMILVFINGSKTCQTFTRKQRMLNLTTCDNEF